MKKAQTEYYNLIEENGHDQPKWSACQWVRELLCYKISVIRSSLSDCHDDFGWFDVSEQFDCSFLDNNETFDSFHFLSDEDIIIKSQKNMYTKTTIVLYTSVYNLATVQMA